MTNPRSLWPTDAFVGNHDTRTPRSILIEQAALLSDATGGMLTAHVRTTSTGTGMRHDVTIVVPVMRNFAFEFLSVSHPLEHYPLLLNILDQRYQANDEQQFVDALTTGLASEKATKALRALLLNAHDFAKPMRYHRNIDETVRVSDAAEAIVQHNDGEADGDDV